MPFSSSGLLSGYAFDVRLKCFVDGKAVFVSSQFLPFLVSQDAFFGQVLELGQGQLGRYLAFFVGLGQGLGPLSDGFEERFGLAVSVDQGVQGLVQVENFGSIGEAAPFQLGQFFWAQLVDRAGESDGSAIGALLEDLFCLVLQFLVHLDVVVGVPYEGVEPLARLW